VDARFGGSLFLRRFRIEEGAREDLDQVFPSDGVFIQQLDAERAYFFARRSIHPVGMGKNVNGTVAKALLGARGFNQFQPGQAAKLQLDQEDIGMATAQFAQAKGSIGGKIHAETGQSQSQKQNQPCEPIPFNQQYPFAI